MDLADSVFDLSGGGRCVGCGHPGSALCTGCAKDLRRAGPVSGIAWVDRAVAGLEYDGAARSLVLALKLSGRRDAATPLAEAMWKTVLRRGLRGTVLTWVPARRSDVRRRGFDHAELLARALARRTGLPTLRLLTRTGVAPDQASLTAAERRHNLVNTFGARPVTDRVVLVDDLVTTGATATACASALRGAGSAGVELIAACRTP